MMIDAAEAEGVAILYLSGDLDAPNCRQVREIAAGLLADGRSSLVIDLSGVERIYTAGIFALLDLQRAAAQRGRRLICCGARPFVRELLRMTMLDRALDLQGDLETALDVSREAS